MKHIYQKGSNVEAPVLLLLHGTGGTETDLLPLAEMVSPGSSVLSVRGNVLENGMPRFFRRLSEGVFDEEDLILRTKELYDYLEWASQEYDFDKNKVVALGYSNGANIAASLMFHYKGALQGRSFITRWSQGGGLPCRPFLIRLSLSLLGITIQSARQQKRTNLPGF